MIIIEREREEERILNDAGRQEEKLKCDEIGPFKNKTEENKSK